jgi:hypothetical protein
LLSSTAQSSCAQCYFLQSTRESNDDRQREFAERLQQHERLVAAAQQAQEAAQARYGEHDIAQKQAMELKTAKEEELRKAQQRWV